MHSGCEVSRIRCDLTLAQPNLCLLLMRMMDDLIIYYYVETEWV